MVRHLLPFCLLVFLAAACRQSEPCIECPDVGGTYEVTAESRSHDLSSCGEIPFPGITMSATIVQDESHLHLVEIGVDGTLFEDRSAFFDPYTLTIRDQSATASWSATFIEGADENWTIQGYLTATRTSDGCTITAPFRGDRQPR